MPDRAVGQRHHPRFAGAGHGVPRLAKVGTKVWGALVAYTVIGAFDYAHGLVTQWIHPQNANSTVTYGAIGFLMVQQLIVAALLFRDDVVQHYTQSHSPLAEHPDPDVNNRSSK